MEERKTFEFRIGIVVVATVLVLVILIVLFGPKRVSLFSGDYTMYVIFDYAPMIQQNSPVFKNGVEIGRVHSTELIENDRSVKVTLRIRRGIYIYSDEECHIKANLMGVTSINFRKRTEKGPTLETAERLPPHSTIFGYSPPDIVSIAGSMEQQVTSALNSFVDATQEITKSFANINMFIGTQEEVEVKQKRLELMIDTAMETMASINKLSIGLESLINDPDIQKNLRSTARDIPQLLQDVQLLMQDARLVLQDLHTITGRVDQTFSKVDRNLDNLSHFTESMKTDGPAFFDKLMITADRLQLTMGELETFMAALNNAEGSIGQILNDPDFFNGIRRTMRNIEDITLQVKPILADARVISDKVARDPGGTIGVRSLLTKSSMTKGTSGTNIGFVSGGGDFPEPQPRFQIAQLPNWWQCPDRARARFKYVMPGSVSGNIPAEYYEYPSSYQPQWMDMMPENTDVRIPEEVYPHVLPPAPTRIEPAPTLDKQVSGLKLEFTPSSQSESNPVDQQQVIPLPPVETARAFGWQTQIPKLQLDFGPAR